jgi:PAS domain S-box-containing protein
MNKSKLKTDQPASLKRKLVRQVVAIVVLSIAITGGVAAFFCFETLPNLFNIPLKSQLDKIIPGLFDIIFLSAIAIMLSLSIAFILFNRAFKQYEQSYDDDSLQDEEQEYSVRTDKLADDNAALHQQLEAEKQLNSLIISLLESSAEDYAAWINSSLSRLGTFCKSDYTAFYNQNDTADAYIRMSYVDSNPELARHSDKLDLLSKNSFQWLNQTLASGKTYLFCKADMDKLVESLQGKTDEAALWMHKQAVETPEYKLCAHEDWQHFAALPYYADGTVKGLFLLGFQAKALPLSPKRQEQLASITSALGDRMLDSNPKLNTGETKDCLDSALANLSDAVFITNADGIIKALNPAAGKLCGSDKRVVTGVYWSEIFNLIDADTLQPVTDPLPTNAAVAGSISFPADVILLTADNREIPVEGIIAPILSQNSEPEGFIFVLRDISGRINDENERIKTQKMEAISSLSAGLAHDFNNLLTAILGNISLVLDDLPPDSEQAKMLKDAEECTLKGRDVTNRLLTFAKGSQPEDVSSEAALTLEKTALELVKDANIRTVFQIERSLPPVKMSAAAFETVIANLVNNALQAMDPSGELRISATAFDNSDGSISSLNKGKFVHIHIIDSGEGISRENLSRIFTPYFTTRTGNSGLGLPTVNSILAKHNGTIRVHSQPGKGTDCELFIPAANPAIYDQTESEPASVPIQYGVLVLDEEDMLGNLLVKTLTRMGLQVAKTSDPSELVALYYATLNPEKPAKLALLNLDVPTVSDFKELAAQLKQADSKLKLIAYSSHLLPDDLPDYQKQGFDDILLKPFNITDLKALVSKNLEV